MFQQHIIAIIWEPQYYKDKSSVLYISMVSIHTLAFNNIQSMCGITKIIHIKIHVKYQNFCQHTIHCLCIGNIIAPWWWLQYVAETCGSEKLLCAAVRSKTCIWNTTAWNMWNIKYINNIWSQLLQCIYYWMH